MLTSLKPLDPHLTSVHYIQQVSLLLCLKLPPHDAQATGMVAWVADSYGNIPPSALGAPLLIMTSVTMSN